MKMISFLMSMLAAFFSSSCTPRTFHPAHPESLTPAGVVAGKWYVSLISGGGVGVLATGLNDFLGPIVTTQKGGSYLKAIEANDAINPAITALEVKNRFQGLTREIEAFKTNNPGAPTQLLVTAALHGKSGPNGEVLLKFFDGALTGAEFASLLFSAGADETIVVIQACHSGSLADWEAKTALDAVISQLNEQAERGRKKAAIMTPVSSGLLSYVGDWEDVIQQSILNPRVDRDNDGVVTYEEWYNGVSQAACVHPNYRPSAFLDSNPRYLMIKNEGLQPHFFHHNIPAALPMFLSRADRVNVNVPSGGNAPALYEETIRICSEQLNVLSDAYGKEARELVAILPTLADRGAISKILRRFLFDVQADLSSGGVRDVILRAMRTGITSAERSDAINLLLRVGVDDGLAAELRAISQTDPSFAVRRAAELVLQRSGH